MHTRPGRQISPGAFGVDQGKQQKAKDDGRGTRDGDAGRVHGIRVPGWKKTNRNEHRDGDAWVVEISTAVVQFRMPQPWLFFLGDEANLLLRRAHAGPSRHRCGVVVDESARELLQKSTDWAYGGKGGGEAWTGRPQMFRTRDRAEGIVGSGSGSSPWQIISNSSCDIK